MKETSISTQTNDGDAVIFDEIINGNEYELNIKLTPKFIKELQARLLLNPNPKSYYHALRATALMNTIIILIERVIQENDDEKRKDGDIVIEFVLDIHRSLYITFGIKFLPDDVFEKIMSSVKRNDMI